MNMRKQLYNTFKYVGFTLLGCVAFIIFYLLLAFILSWITVDAEHNANKDIEVYLLSNGVHTDIVLPVKTAHINWSDYFKFEHTVGKDTAMNWIAIGWGDKGFFLETPTWADLKFSTAVNAALGFSTAAIHTTYYKDIKEHERCIKFAVSHNQYQRLINYINNSLLTNKENNIQFIQTNAVYGKTDAFYEAKGSYNITRTCNTWTNNALKASGQRACLWTPFDKGILYQYSN